MTQNNSSQWVSSLGIVAPIIVAIAIAGLTAMWYLGVSLGGIDERLKALEASHAADQLAFTAAMDRQADTNEKLNEAIIQLQAATDRWRKTTEHR